MRPHVIRFSLLVALLLLLAGGYYVAFSPFDNVSLTEAAVVSDQDRHEAESDEEDEEGDKRTRIWEAIKDHEERTLDQELGYVPYERLIEANRMIKRRQEALLSADPSRGDITLPRWRERGPTNIGGRTRAVMIDEGSADRNRVFAGGVSGGLWVTEDISQAQPIWTAINDWWSNISVGFIAQDPNNTDIIYVGTGEGTANGSIIPGNGIFVSTDGGQTFSETADIQAYSFCHHAIVDPRNSMAYFATNRGLYRTDDQGQSYERVLSTVLGATSNNMWDLQYVDGFLYASDNRNIYKSPSGDVNSWEEITTGASGFPGSWSRVEFSVSKSNPEVIYAIGNESGGASRIHVTQNGGDNWQAGLRPMFDGIEFTRGQVWYDLDIAVSPFDPGFIIAGGVPISYSTNGGSSLSLYDYSFHVDQHGIFFDEKDPNRILFGNDGGVYMSTNGTPNDVQDKNNIYNVSQYYACALHPETFSDYMLGGTQDNGSHALDNPRVGPARYVNGGDGVYCHIDQDDPSIQWVSSQFGNYRLSTDGGNSFGGGVNVEGSFINRSDYDNDADILYAQTSLGDYYRYAVGGGTDNGPVSVPGFGINVSTVHADASTPNRVYFGGSGQVVRVDNAHDTPSATNLGSFGGSITGIYVQPDDPDRIGVVVGNYGVSNNIYLSTNGGETWVGCEGNAIANNLPDIPVNDIVFNPDNPEQALIATDAGVWSTDKLDGNQTKWFPPVPNTGIPVVRTDMLQVRQSDKIVLAGTYGRGLWTSDVFADPNARFLVDQVHYTDSPLEFTGSAAYGAESWQWDFGDGTSSTASDPRKSYDNIGSYEVEMTINGDLDETKTVKILPDVALPYVKGEDYYAGGFENQTEQYGVYTVRGTGWERGSSPINGKTGTKNGDFAYSTGVLEQYYQPNSESYLYLPNFDLSESGIYAFSFWGRWVMDQGLDGIQVQYSLNRGQNWQVLGSREDPDWYNFVNNDGGGAFPQGASYFTGQLGGWRQYSINVSDLSGNADVAFRILFKSEATGQHRGAAIDDVQITKYDGPLVTRFTSASAEYSEATEITVDWSTQPEYQARRFIIERSTNGKVYEAIDSVYATGITTAEAQVYSYDFRAQRDLYFVRIRAINGNSSIDYYEEILSPTMVVRRRDEPTTVNSIFPSPFTSYIDVTFNNLVDGPVDVRLYDAAGRLITRSNRTMEQESFYTLDVPDVAEGTYFLSVQIGDDEPTTTQVMHFKE